MASGVDIDSRVGSMFVATRVSIVVPRWLADFAEMAAKFYGCTPKYFWTFMAIDFCERHYAETKSLLFSTYAAYIMESQGKGLPKPPTPFDDTVLKGVIEAQQLDKVLKMQPTSVECNIERPKRTNMVVIRFGAGEIPWGIVKKLLDPPLNFRPTLGRDGIEALMTDETNIAAEDFVKTYGRAER